MPIREALIPDDLTRVRTLFEEYAASLGIDLCFQGFADELRTLPGSYQPPLGGLWLAHEDGQAVGCVALRPLDASRCEMKRLYLKPGFRGAGRGRRLAETVIDAAAGAGYRSLCLDTMPTMDGAIALYRSLGFVEIDAYCYNPVAGALFMELRFD